MKRTFLIITVAAVILSLIAYGIAYFLLYKHESEKNKQRTSAATAARVRMAELKRAELEEQLNEPQHQNDQTNETETTN